MSIKPISISRTPAGANTLGGGDGVSAMILIVPAGAIPAGVASGTPFVVNSLGDVEGKGLTSENDTSKSALIYYHAKEFYKQAPSGTKLYLMLVGSTLTGTAPNQTASVKMQDIFDSAIYAQKLIDFSAGDIALMAVGTSVVNTGTASLYVNGLPDFVYHSISKAQAFADACFDARKPLHIVIEGRDWQGNASSSADLKNIPGVKASHVSLTLAQDYDYASSLTASILKKHASVGTLLGMLSKLGVANNPGEINVVQNSLLDVAGGRWVTPALSNGTKITEQRSGLETLDAKGYVFALDYAPYEGTYFNDGFSCNAEVKDSLGSMSISTLMLSRITNKVARILYVALMPYVKKKYPTDSSTGKLPSGVIKEIESYAEDQLLPMIRAGEISAVQVRIDPDSDLLSGEKILKISSVKIVPYGYASSISIGLSINASL